MADEDPDRPNPLIERAREALGGNPASRDVPGDGGDVEAPEAPAAARELPDVAQEAEPRPPRGPQDAEGPQPPLTPARFKPRGVSLKGTEGARLLATQMAVAGCDRSEIEQRLATEFGVGDPGPLVDEIFQEDS